MAIKVLPEEFASDPDRVARFQRKAKLLASLNHPNIAAIHGLEEFGETRFLVLELVEGETLAEQLKRGAIAVEASLKLALQIAEALEAAHEKGVIHRDLKPANIKVTPDGRWMAYTSNESGKDEIYVRPFPDVEKGGRWQVSTSGGDSPLWSPDSRELFYRTGDAVMGVSVTTEPAFSLETPKMLFRGTYAARSGSNISWDISPDGKRFLMTKDAGTAGAGDSPRRINIVLNWLEELKQRLPAK